MILEGACNALHKGGEGAGKVFRLIVRSKCLDYSHILRVLSKSKNIFGCQQKTTPISHAEMQLQWVTGKKERSEVSDTFAAVVVG